MSPKPELPDDLARLGSLADEPLPPPSKERCLDAHDCRAPIAPSLQPAPAGRH